jgi:aminomethyltransferase
MPVRAGAPLFADEEGDSPIGSVTSGCFGPSLDAPAAMGYLPTARAVPRTTVFAEVRGKRFPVAVATLPFLAPKYKRG